MLFNSPELKIHQNLMMRFAKYSDDELQEISEDIINHKMLDGLRNKKHAK